MKNYLHEGERVRFTVPSGGVVAGLGVLIGQLFLVSVDTAAQGAEATGVALGAVELAKTEALAISFGDALYWDDTNKVVNKTSSGQKEVGIAIGAAANPSLTVRVLLCPTVRTSVAA